MTVRPHDDGNHATNRPALDTSSANGATWGRRLALMPALLLALAACGASLRGCKEAPSDLFIRADVVAVGIPGAGAIAQVGRFHPGGPIHDREAFAAYTKPGAILDPTRIMVASSSAFGAPAARPDEAVGTVLSIDGAATGLQVPPAFAAEGGQATALGGAVRVFTGQSARFVNAINNPAASTATEPGGSLPLSISLNNGFGRPWFANAPFGLAGPGTISVVDPDGVPLAGAPFAAAGGVFSGTATNRSEGVGRGIPTGAVGAALLTKSPDGSGRAVFVAALADGSVAQVHVGKGVDDLLPPNSFTAFGALSVDIVESNDPKAIARVGVAFNWVPSRFLLITDPRANRILRVALADDGVVFSGAVTYLTPPGLDVPIDLAPTIPEVANPNFASGSTLGGGADVYVLNRGDNSIVRMRVDGVVVARRQIRTSVVDFRANGIAVSSNGQRIWVTGTTANHGGVVLRLPAFGSGAATERVVASARAAGALDVVSLGAHAFSFNFDLAEGLGPLFNERSCLGCHHAPDTAGMGTEPGDMVTAVARIEGRVVDRLEGRGGPVARMRSISELGGVCELPTGVPRAANVVSRRNAMTLRGTALIDAIAEADIIANQARQPVEVRGKLNRLSDGRIGRFGWKAQVPTLVEFMAVGLRDELGVTNALLPHDFVVACGAVRTTPEVDGVLLQALAAFLEGASPAAVGICDKLPGGELFRSIGCAGCHTPTFAVAGRTTNIFSDLLVHDMGSALDDGLPQGSASGTEWRTPPLSRLRDRNRYLHDGRATSVSAAIQAHSGQATTAKQAFSSLEDDSRRALLAFVDCL